MRIRYTINRENRPARDVLKRRAAAVTHDTRKRNEMMTEHWVNSLDQGPLFERTESGPSIVKRTPTDLPAGT